MLVLAGIRQIDFRAVKRENVQHVMTRACFFFAGDRAGGLSAHPWIFVIIDRTWVRFNDIVLIAGFVELKHLGYYEKYYCVKRQSNSYYLESFAEPIVDSVTISGLLWVCTGGLTGAECI